MLSRRSFLAWSTAGVGALVLSSRRSPAAAKRPPILFNQVGFTPKGSKRFLATSTASTFDLLDAASEAICHTAAITVRSGDFGTFAAGNFDSFTTPGVYLLRCGNAISPRFTIGADVYSPLLRNTISYFQKQRCGDSKTGYNAPCHLDDGIRDDNGKRLNVTGGWHDACDVRKWVSATIYGMIGLARMLELDTVSALNHDDILAELKWGNRYFLAMQAPAGYVMDWCGGDIGNRFTDNRIGSADDRPIRTAPCEQPGQYQFIVAQALAAKAFRASDPNYAGTCLAAARRCLAWCEPQPRTAAMAHAAGVSAAVALFRATGDAHYVGLVEKHLDKLIRLQARGSKSETDGFFFRGPESQEPLRDIADGNLPLIALCEAMEAFPRHPQAAAWREALSRHVDHLAALGALGAFDTIPFGLYTSDPGGDRRLGDYWYRWFMKQGHDTQNDDWWVGINAHLGSHGVGLARASCLLGQPHLMMLAQRQLDWILGSNPFFASTVTGAGANQPELFKTSEFVPHTPLLVGGVMNGLGGTPNDQPLLGSGKYNTSEYWTPMISYFSWLLSLLAHEGNLPRP